MSDQENKEQRLGLWLVGGAAGLAVLTTLFLSVWGWETGKIEGSPQYGAKVEEVVVVEETANPADVILTEAVDGARVVVENGVVKFYFASGKADLASGADEALQEVLAGVKDGRKAVVSGFHDASGNQALNEELSKQRAFAVRDALLVLGVPEGQIELRKPNDSEGSGNPAEARRVEVVLE